MDSASEGQEKSVRYLMDKTTLEDITFITDNIPKSINQFRSLHDKRIKQWCTTDKDGRIMMKNRFRCIDDKFFNLIPKAMAFRPINDIKDFVYSYVLDEKEVNIDVLRENVRAYQELQKTLDSVKLRISKLENIERFHDRVMVGMESDKMYDYYLENVGGDILQNRIKRLERELNRLENSLKETDVRLQAIAKEKKERQSIRDALYTEIAADKDFIAIDEQKKHLEQLKLRKEAFEPERAELYRSVKQAKRMASELMQLTETPACISSYIELLDKLKHIDDPEQIAELKTVLQEVTDYKRNSYDKIQLDLAKLNIESNRIIGELQEVNEKIALLKKHRLLYPKDMSRVLDSISEKFDRIGRKVAPKILCELLEINDDSWRNAVEGYLNTQRFYILVEPDSFDIALGTYDRLRKEKKAFGVGLINTRSLDKYETAPEGSLAMVVSSRNEYAKRYANMILGKVHMCDNYNQLKSYKTSITRGCMKYQNHVASAIKPSIYQTPYIGKDAIKIQL